MKIEKRTNSRIEQLTNSDTKVLGVYFFFLPSLGVYCPSSISFPLWGMTPDTLIVFKSSLPVAWIPQIKRCGVPQQKKRHQPSTVGKPQSLGCWPIPYYINFLNETPWPSLASSGSQERIFSLPPLG
eukprot:scaffold3223_cov69-Cylindrotheca_fusiformis.AAC.1